MAAKKTDEAQALPDREAAAHRGWRVKAQVKFTGKDGNVHLRDELPREKVKAVKFGEGEPRLGARKMKRGPDGKLTPVTPEEEPVIIGRDLIPHDQAVAFERDGALVPHYA